MKNINYRFFCPATYMPASTPVCHQRINAIANAATQKGRLEATYLASTAIARTTLINACYYLSKGILNAIMLFSKKSVLTHYQKAFITLTFAAISVIYVAPEMLYAFSFEGSRIIAQQVAEKRAYQQPHEVRQRQKELS